MDQEEWKRTYPSTNDQDTHWGPAKDPFDDLWYPVQWRDSGKFVRRVEIGHTTPADCAAYLRRSGLTSQPELPPAHILGKRTYPGDEIRTTNFSKIFNHGEVVNPPPDDDRFDWVQIGTFENPDKWIKGECRHKTPEPVDAYPTGELVAWLCPDCGQTFDADRWQCPEGMWYRIPILFDKISEDPVPIPETVRPVPASSRTVLVRKVACATMTWVIVTWVWMILIFGWFE